MRLQLHMAAICGGGALLGLVLNVVSHRPARLFTEVRSAAESGTSECSISPEAQHEKHAIMLQKDAVAACGDCTVAFVDARSAAAFAEGHIPQAVHLQPEGHPDLTEQLVHLHTYATVVVYDSGGDCGLAEGMADRLTAAGLKDVRLLEGSWTDWMGAGGPAASGACEACAHAETHAPGDER